MKKFNKNIIVFIFVFLFILVGVFGSGDFLSKFFKETKHFIKSIPKLSTSSFDEYKNTIESISCEKLSYHDGMVNLHSVYDNLLGTRVVDKEETVVVKAESGGLVGYLQTSRYNSGEIDTVNQIKEYKKFADNNDARFLVCKVPSKALYEELPSNVTDYSKENYNTMVNDLKSDGISVLDCVEEFEKNNMSYDEIFFNTDHHWTPYAGFTTTRLICEELSHRYGFKYEKEYLNPNNYEIKKYSDCFLGSYGKKVGLWFSWRGADDFELFTPKFNSNFTETHNGSVEERSGEFVDTCLDMDKFVLNHYHSNLYHTYSGGTFRLQVVKNKLTNNSEKILVIRNSFACVVTPFLSLQARELHIIDDREGDYPEGDKVDVKRYIEETKPDYIVVIK